MDKRTLLYSIGSLICIVIVLILLRAQNNPDEEEKMLVYLEKKYNQEFVIEEVTSFDSGFAVGEFIEAKAVPVSDEKLSFIVTREQSRSTYEDTYARKVINTTLVEELLPRVRELSEDAKFYVQSSHKVVLNNRLTKRSYNNLQPSVVVGVPVETPFDQEKYNKPILTFLNEIEKYEFQHYTVRIDFINKNRASIMDKYMKLSLKDLTQTEKEKQDFLEVKRQYEEAIKEKFTFNSNEEKFMNDPDFIQSLFSGK